MTTNTEDYRCLSKACGKKYKGKLGPTKCPHCGHIWVKWLSFSTYDEKRAIDTLDKPDTMDKRGNSYGKQ